MRVFGWRLGIEPKIIPRTRSLVHLRKTAVSELRLPLVTTPSISPACIQASSCTPSIELASRSRQTRGRFRASPHSLAVGPATACGSPAHRPRFRPTADHTLVFVGLPVPGVTIAAPKAQRQYQRAVWRHPARRARDAPPPRGPSPARRRRWPKAGSGFERPMICTEWMERTIGRCSETATKAVSKGA